MNLQFFGGRGGASGKSAGISSTDKLSESTIGAIQDYTMGEEFRLSVQQFREIEDSMSVISSSMYRVEDIERTAEALNLKEGQTFNFSTEVFESKNGKQGALRSFTNSEGDISELLEPYGSGEAVVYKTVGKVKQLNVSKYSMYDQHESLTYSNNWKVKKISNTKIAGQSVKVYEIEQL